MQTKKDSVFALIETALSALKSEVWTKDREIERLRLDSRAYYEMRDALGIKPGASHDEAIAAAKESYSEVLRLSNNQAVLRKELRTYYAAARGESVEEEPLTAPVIAAIRGNAPKEEAP